MQSKRIAKLYTMFLVVSMASILLSCSTKSTAQVTSTIVSTVSDKAFSVQKYTQMSVSLHGFMTFELSGTQLAYQTDFQVSSVLIEWMGSILNGILENIGPGNDVTDIVHGALSEDGEWLSSLTFSRQVIRKNVSNGTLFRVTLINIPLTVGTGDNPSGYSGTGADVHKFIDKIEYSEGSLVNGKIVPETKYISTDWNNMKEGQIPILKVTFETSDQNNSPWQETGQGGGGMMGQ